MRKFTRKFSSPKGSRFLAVIGIVVIQCALIGSLIGGNTVSVAHSDQVTASDSSNSSSSASASDYVYVSTSGSNTQVNMDNSASSSASSNTSGSAIGSGSSDQISVSGSASSSASAIATSSVQVDVSNSSSSQTIIDATSSAVTSASSNATSSVQVVTNSSSSLIDATSSASSSAFTSANSNIQVSVSSSSIQTTINATSSASSSASASAGSSASSSASSSSSATATSSVSISIGNSSSSSSSSLSSSTFSTPQADLSITKSIDNINPSQGATVHYAVTVSALGPATSTDVIAMDILPTGVTFVSATTSLGSYASSTGIWMIGDMSASSTATLTIAATVTASAGMTVTNAAAVDESASSTDTNTGNNAAAVSFIVTAPVCTSNCGGGANSALSANLAVTKIVDNATPYQGDTVHYTIVISDPGPASSTNVVATDTLPFNLIFVDATTSQGSYASSTGTWLVGNMAVGSTATMIVTAIINASSGTTIVNTVDVNGTPDPSASATLTVIAPSGCTSNCGGGGGGSVITSGGGGSVIMSGGGSAYDLTIDGGASSTATTSVMLSLYGTEAYTIEVSNTPDFASSTWIPYSTTLPWILTSGAGPKTVYVQYRSVSGTIIGSANASIELVQVPGKVLGASISCGVYLDSYIRLGIKNNPYEVKKLQVFLNENLGTNLPITGYYGKLTYAAVEQFQVKYHQVVLLPWVPYGLANEMTPTGYVYKTTKRWINELMCPPLDLPLPQLP